MPNKTPAGKTTRSKSASKPLGGKTIAFLVAPEGVEQVELTEPWKAVESAGGTAKLVSLKSGKVQAFNHLDKADTFAVDETVDKTTADSYDALVLPGGVANPDRLRTDAKAVAFTKEFATSGKPIAVICHGPWTLVEAGVLQGRTITSWQSLKTDITNAGGTWVDEEVHVDTNGPGPLVSSRKPDDLKAFCQELIDTFATV
jgi:protease I